MAQGTVAGTRRRDLCAGAALGLLTGCAGVMGLAPAAVRNELISDGKLRAAINFGNPILATRGNDGQPRGVSVDLASEVARQLDGDVELVTFNSAGAVVEAVKAVSYTHLTLPTKRIV